MGMAASQARFLGLTARKTNTEYEGQQVNQQRTALANQSAGLFNELLSLKVPTPPLATDYSKSEYVFTNPATSDEIALDYILKNPIGDDGKQTYTVDGKIKTTDYLYNIATRTYGTGDANAYSVRGSDTDPVTYSISIGNGDYMELMGPERYDVLTDKFNAVDGAPGDCQPGDTFYKYVDTRSGIAYFINSNNFNPAAQIFPAELQIYSQQSYAKDAPFHSDNAELTQAQDGTGRFTSIRFATGTDANGNPVNFVTCALEMRTTQDEEAFDDAMNQYNAEKAQYDKRVAEIDAQTIIIQQQDRTLELHLTQLDTEQQAIQTELDAVKKVIDKNIEETFKTFA